MVTLIRNCLLRNAFEEVFPHFHKMQLREAVGRNRDLDFTAYVLRLEAAILERDKVSYQGLFLGGLTYNCECCSLLCSLRARPGA